MSTTLLVTGRTHAPGGQTGTPQRGELWQRHQTLLSEGRFSRTEHYRLLRELGSGGQGVVYLTERRGCDGFTLPVAVKVFSPDRYVEGAYETAMAKAASVAARIARIQHDNLIDVHNFFDRDRVRLLEMEWIDGFDLERLLDPTMLDYIWNRVSARRWKHLNDVIITSGPQQPRLKPGVAVAIIRDCLSALAALHRNGLVHGDIKPSNIMLKRTGTAKLIDIGSAFDQEDIAGCHSFTPQYAAPEVVEGAECSPQSDMCSLGYVLFEMLAGRRPFAADAAPAEIITQKLLLMQNLESLLPEDVACNRLLMRFCRGLITPDPALRFPNAELADVVPEGAAGFQTQLVKGNLDTQYDHEIRLWLEALEDVR